MNSRSVFFKAGLATILLAGSVAPVLASGTDQIRVLAIGAPATDSEFYIGKKFNFSADELDHRLPGGGFNYSPDRDKSTVQQAK